MREEFKRNEFYWGNDFQEYLKELCVAVFGLGGVGGFALEALTRAGVGKFILVDFDVVSKTNINRQIIALHSTVGKKKTDVFLKRLKDINPDVELQIFDDFYDESLNESIFKENIDFAVDAIDSLRSKISLLTYCHRNKINVVSSMGAGNRIDGSKLFVDDIKNLKPNCTFVKNVLMRLKKEGIEEGIIAVASSERPFNLTREENIEKIIKKDGTTVEFKKITPASTPVVPAIAGYLAANVILCKLHNEFKL